MKKNKGKKKSTIDILDPTYLKGFNDGSRNGEKVALEKIYAYIKERILTIEQVEGVGEKTAARIHEHLLNGIEKEGE